ncbi:GlcG/HbpS family heme-binding protein [Phytopseudomonas seleniipraecipitans]|uniref:Glc operon protein GlcG n=1 Tax=Phytopseudomonas seleniipraecipitans TaxID=640205 RepID=A0A1G7RSH1_9GAMM|nr:heme-binding protein [Pseudomonas seleniipraecipitans]SDG13574.1 glc operon protein GlcG [Pseudomonas seleniipraecipitans]
MHSRPSLDAQEITALLDAALAEAGRNEWLVSIAVVDDGGHLLAFRRLPGATPSSAQIAIDKARSAALTRRPTRFFADMLSTGQPGAAFLHNVMPMPGGLPLLHEGQCLGGIAASGVRADFDEQIATAGIAALALTEQRHN